VVGYSGTDRSRLSTSSKSSYVVVQEQGPPSIPIPTDTAFGKGGTRI
jgi:hypothetical protein